MRPIRKKKSKKLGEFYYPPNTKKTIKIPQKKTENLRTKKVLNKLSRVLPASPIRTQSPIPLLSPVQSVEVNPQSPTQIPQTPPEVNQDLEELFTNPNLPSSYSGDLKKYILQKESISRHKKKINIFKRRQIFVIGPWVAIQADTVFYIDTGPQNNGYKYILGKILSCRNLIL